MLCFLLQEGPAPPAPLGPVPVQPGDHLLSPGVRAGQRAGGLQSLDPDVVAGRPLGRQPSLHQHRSLLKASLIVQAIPAKTTMLKVHTSQLLHD